MLNILGITIQNLVTWVTRWLGHVHNRYGRWYEDTLSLRNDTGKWETTNNKHQTTKCVQINLLHSKEAMTVLCQNQRNILRSLIFFIQY